MLNSCHGHNQSKCMGDVPVPEPKSVMLTGIYPSDFSFPIPILSAALNFIIYYLRIKRLYAVKEKEKGKTKAHLIVFSIFALSQCCKFLLLHTAFVNFVKLCCAEHYRGLSLDFISHQLAQCLCIVAILIVLHLELKNFACKRRFEGFFLFLIVFLNFDLFEDILLRIFLLEIFSQTLLLILLKLFTATQLIL